MELSLKFKLVFSFTRYLFFSKEIDTLANPIPNIINAVFVPNSPNTAKTVIAIPIASPIPFGATSKISANFRIEFISGNDKSLSHLETALSVTSPLSNTNRTI